MRTLLASLIVGLVSAGIPAANEARAQVAFSAGVQVQSVADFNAPLTPYGTWVAVPSYGRCWHPNGVDFNWRPYTVGTWEWTDAGWYWASDEPWGWACYHYGTWVYDPNYGWVWMPGTEWAPAWVAWRESPDYVGWAPCTASGVVLAPSSFVFVDVHHFHDRLRPGLLAFNDNAVFERSRRVGSVTRERRRVDGFAGPVFTDPGPNPEAIGRATGTRFTQRPLSDVVVRNHAPETARHRPATQVPLAPTGREQPRVYPAPVTPQLPARTPELPTPRPHREVPRLPAEREPNIHREQPAPRVNRENPQPRIEQANPSPRNEHPSPPPRQVAPPREQRPTPAQPQGRPDQRERDRQHDD